MLRGQASGVAGQDGRPFRIADSWLLILAAHPLKSTFVLALLVRLINIALLTHRDAFFAEQDAFGYWALGAALAKRETFWPTLLAMTDRMPLYPLLVAGIQHIFGDAPRAVALVQAVIDATTCALIAALGGLALATRPAIALLLGAAVPLVFVIALVQRRSVGLALAAAALFAIAAAAPIAPVLLRNVVYYQSSSLTSQGGDHLALWIVPLVTQRANGTPYQATVDRMEARYRERAERDSSGATNPFRRATMKSELAREEMARLPAGAYARAWLEGVIINLAAPALLADPRVRALPKPSFYDTPGTSLWQRARAYLFDDPGAYQVLLLLGLLGMLPFLALEATGLVMLARRMPWAAACAGGVLAYFLLLSGPVAAPKYRLPMEPVLIVLAAIPLARLAERRLIRSRMLT